MKATEIIKLSLAGKTPAEIRELMELENELKAAEIEQAEPTKVYEKPEAPEKTPAEETPKAENEPEAPDLQPEPDYKKLYEESQAELKKAQAANSKNDMSGGEDPAETRQKKIEDLVRSFM